MLLATAYCGLCSQHVQRAYALWNEGEKALAQFHLAHANLPRCDQERALRLFVAEELLGAVTPAALMKAQGFDPALLKIFHPDELRVPAGSGLPLTRRRPRW